MKVGELAERTGLSVRTLHHYDEIGLLAPAARTQSGHRIYGMAEVRRLQQIASLRHLGLSLDEIRGCLARPGYSLDRVLEMQVTRMREEMDRQRRLITLLENLRRRLRQGEDVTVDDVAETIEQTARFERYYTPEQRAQIARRAEALGADRIREGERSWATLFGAFEDAMKRGVDPASDEVQVLAERANALIEEFTGGDAGIRDSLARMYREEGPDKVMGGQGVQLPDGLWSYYGRALQLRRDRRGAAS
jgi:DNA-binding transcriptional MerR regulator